MPEQNLEPVGPLEAGNYSYKGPSLVMGGPKPPVSERNFSALSQRAEEMEPAGESQSIFSESLEVN